MKENGIGNPDGRPAKDAQVIREKHRRFIAQCFVHGYNIPDAIKMLSREYGLEVTYNSVNYWYLILAKYGPAVYTYFPLGTEVNLETVAKVLIELKPRSKQWVGMFHDYIAELRKIEDDPNHGIPYADKRKRALKLSQNIDELDKEKLTAKGSYPTSRNEDGVMTFEKFEIKNKDHGEQRKTIDALGGLVDGVTSSQVTVNIIDHSKDADEIPPDGEVKPSEDGK